MDCIQYSTKHEDLISDALVAHGLPLSLVDDLPSIGYVALKNGYFIAAAFIRQVEGKHGMVDSMVSHPDASPEDRNKALDIINLQLIEKAKELGLSQLTAFTGDENTVMRAERLGYVVTPYRVIALKLSTKAE